MITILYFSVRDTVDGIVVSNLLLTNGTQDIIGVKTFNLDVSVTPTILVNGLLNGVDLVDLFQNTVRTI